MLFVTGITGHSGSYFLKELIAHQYEGPIRCVVRSSSDTSLIDSSGLRIEKVVGDLNDQEFMDKAMIGVDTDMHIASIFHSVTVIKAAVKNSVRRAILVHTAGIYSKYKDASEEYKNIELEVNNIIENNASQISLVILRPTMIYGNINDNNMIIFIKMLDKLRLFPVIDHGQSLLQPVNARDLGKAYYKVLTNPSIMNAEYILSGKKPITMLNMFKLISSILGKKTLFVSVPLAVGVLLARILKLFTLGRIDYIEKVQRMGEDRSFSHAAATQDFGYDPMPFEEGIRIEVKQYVDKFR
ncbi:MAG: NAD(P)H-binding protein [Syntrophomonadaceae bacterium]|nr:NAD(P)H-binding protein [Syntrophomonadaceae bacterium]